MGIGFTIDTPLKVAKYGINSVLSIGDDILLEKLRKHYTTKFELPYTEISKNQRDFRAKRITEYLNLIKTLVEQSFNSLKAESLGKGKEITKYFNLLSEESSLKKQYLKFLSVKDEETRNKLEKSIKSEMRCGSIDVNIMTKVDKANYDENKQQLPHQFNDAHAGLRGFAFSDLNSSVVLSAGLNPRLYSYISEFTDFFPDNNGVIKKKIILKVSDYRSAAIQGKFLAKKGIYVSEYRIESGLNCGGHAFATKGLLMGPILQEFKENKNELQSETLELCKQYWQNEGFLNELKDPNLKISAQGGVGTNSEHKHLLEYYQLDSIGWGTPFLLVPEAINIDVQTLDLLQKAQEDDLYLSHTSPLGVLFNTLKGNSKDWEKQQLINKNRPGSSCPKKFLSLNTEFTDQPICTASRQYQDLKIKDLESKNLPEKQLKQEIAKVTEKSCICVGLGTPALLVNDLDAKVEGKGVSVCPGPNLAYFDKISTLQEMVDHIYGRTNILAKKYRPHMFIKELDMYVNYLKKEIDETIQPITDKQKIYFNEFISNILNGIDYYKKLFANWKLSLDSTKNDLDLELCRYETILKGIDVNDHQVMFN